MRIKSDKQIISGMLYAAVLCALLFCLSVKVHAENEYQVTEMQMQGEITTDSTLNVRSGPGKEYDVIGKVKNDVMLEITGQADNGWYQIVLDGKTGFVSDQYVTAEEIEDAGDQVGEPEEGYRGLNQSPQMKKILIIGVIIVVVLVMLVVTLKSMRQDDEDDEDEYDDDEEDYEEDDEDEEDEDEDVEDEDDSDVVERAVRKETQEGIRKREYVIREEDYRVQIDPRFFEEKEPIEQPAMVTGYLERKKIEDAIGETEFREVQEPEKIDLDTAMEKLNELQKEIERLKNGK